MKKVITVTTRQPGLWLDTDITYAQVPAWYGHITRSLKLSLIRHFEDQPAPLPCIVWICGGAWLRMDQNAHLPNLIELAHQGFVIASLEYRTSNEINFPGALEDAKAALRFLRANAARYQIDPGRIGVMGESAGGHLASLVGVTGGLAEFDQGDYLDFSSGVKSVCAWYTPAVFPLKDDPNGPGITPEDLLLGELAVRVPDLAARVSPLTYITEKTHPFLILHGTQDATVPVEQGEKLYEALSAKGVPADLYLIEGADHASIEFFQQQVKQIIADFFKRTL